MRIFVSHSSDDEELASVLVILLQTALPISGDDIRCTTLPGLGLPTGSNILDALRADVREADVAIGLLTPSALSSIWVLFELGARWGLGQNILPLCAKGLTPQDLPAPLRSLVAADCRNREQLLKLLEDVARVLHLELAGTSTYDRFLSQIAEKALVSDDETVISSNSWSPRLDLEWADLESGKYLSTKFSLTSLFLEKPTETLEQKPSRDALGILIDPFENTSYFQEVIDYAADQAFYSPLSLRIKNDSEAISRRVRFVGQVMRTEGLTMKEEMDPLPEKSYSSSSLIEIGGREVSDEAKVSLRTYENRWEVKIDFDDIRPHDDRVSLPLWFGATRSQNVSLEGELRGDDLKNPIDCVLKVGIETERRQINLEDIRPFLDSE